MGTKKLVPLLVALFLQNVFCDDPTEEKEDKPAGERQTDIENQRLGDNPEVKKGIAHYPVTSHHQLHHFIERHNSIEYANDPTEMDFDPTEKPDVEIHETSAGFQSPAAVVSFQGVCEPLAPGGFYDNRRPNMKWLRTCQGPYAADNLCMNPVEGKWLQCLEVEQPLRAHPTEDDIALHQEMKKYFGAAKCGGELHGETMPFPEFYLSWSTYKEKGRNQKRLICITGASARDRSMKKRCTTCQCKGCRGHCDADLEYWISNVVPDVGQAHNHGGEQDPEIEDFNVPKEESDEPFPPIIGQNFKEIRKAVLEKITRDRVAANIAEAQKAEAERLKIENGEGGEE